MASKHEFNVSNDEYYGVIRPLLIRLHPEVHFDGVIVDWEDVNQHMGMNMKKYHLNYVSMAITDMQKFHIARLRHGF